MSSPDQRLWTVCRILRRDIDAVKAGFAAELDEGFVQRRLDAWTATGVLEQTRPAEPEIDQRALYRVARNVGRFPPGDPRNPKPRGPKPKSASRERRNAAPLYARAPVERPMLSVLPVKPRRPAPLCDDIRVWRMRLAAA